MGVFVGADIAVVRPILFVGAKDHRARTIGALDGATRIGVEGTGDGYIRMNENAFYRFGDVPVMVPVIGLIESDRPRACELEGTRMRIPVRGTVVVIL